MGAQKAKKKGTTTGNVMASGLLRTRKATGTQKPTGAGKPIGTQKPIGFQKTIGSRKPARTGKPIQKKGWIKGSSQSKSKGRGKVNKGGLTKDPLKKVWVGNLPESVTWKDLQSHMNQAGKTSWIEVFSGSGVGTGAVAYRTAETATKAIELMNGTELGGASIICDVWVKRELPQPKRA